MSTSSPQRRLTAAEMYFYTELRSSLGDMDAEHWLSGTSSTCAGSRRVSSVANRPNAQLPTERRKSDQLQKSSQDSWSDSEASSADTQRPPTRTRRCSFAQESLAAAATDIERFSSGVLHKCHIMMQKSFTMSHSFLVRKYGDKAGLLFTDAAHEVLEHSTTVVSRQSSITSRRSSVSRRRSSSLAITLEYPTVSEYESDPALCHVASWCWSTRRSSVSNDDGFVRLIVMIVVFLLLIISLRVPLFI
jgi:hypothetical protein